MIHEHTPGEAFLARLFNVRAATAGPVTVIYDRGWLGEVRDMWRIRAFWGCLVRDKGLVGVLIGPVTVWWEARR